ncbi:hypothetical protein BDR07DRAFT_845719 [Suillus spraguei]|nr:hypothetical protein BDR07DRAFT_845719 [Suillus spraguei]
MILGYMFRPRSVPGGLFQHKCFAESSESMCIIIHIHERGEMQRPCPTVSHPFFISLLLTLAQTHLYVETINHDPSAFDRTQILSVPETGLRSLSHPGLVKL